MAESMCEKEFQKKSDELARYIDRKARQFRSLHFGYGLKEIKEFICILFKNAPPRKLTVSKAFVGKVTARIYCDRKSSKAIKTHIRKAFEEIGVEGE